MSMYSRPDKRRMNNEAERIFQAAGQTATWKCFLSAVAGIPEAGIGDSAFYNNRLITAQFRALPTFMENVAAPGLIAAGQTQMVSRERIGRQDEILWQGSTYRVESDPAPAPLVGWWACMLKRASE